MGPPFKYAGINKIPVNRTIPAAVIMRDVAELRIGASISGRGLEGILFMKHVRQVGLNYGESDAALSQGMGG